MRALGGRLRERGRETNNEPLDVPFVRAPPGQRGGGPFKRPRVYLAGGAGGRDGVGAIRSFACHRRGFVVVYLYRVVSSCLRCF